MIYKKVASGTLSSIQLFFPSVQLFVYFHNRFRVGVGAHEKERGAQGNDNHKVRRDAARRGSMCRLFTFEVSSVVIVKKYELRLSR